MIAKLTMAVLLIGALLAPGGLAAQEPSAADHAVAATAQAWLELLDRGEYGETWSQAAPIFQGSVTAEQWATAARSAREQVGVVVSRSVSKVAAPAQLPGAPPGEYRVVEFTSAFGGLPRATETVVLRREGAEWKVVGTWVRPA